MAMKLDIDKRAEEIKKIVLNKTQNDTQKLSVLDKDDLMNASIPNETSPSTNTLKGAILSDMNAFTRRLEAIRKGTDKSVGTTDISFADAVRSAYGFSSVDDFLRIGLGVEPSRTSVVQFQASPEYNLGYRWLLPELILEAIRLGFRKTPMYQQLVSRSISLSMPDAKFPAIDFSDATPTIISEADTIPTGSLSFQEKTVNTFKIGSGFKVTDEVAQYVSLDVLSLYFQDMAVRLNNALDALAVITLLNGNRVGEEAPVIGVGDVADGIVYKDLLRCWTRGSRLGRSFTSFLAEEELALDLLLLKEFFGFSGETTKGGLTLNQNVPSTSGLMITGAIPSNSLLMVDTSAALVQLNVEALNVESERIVQNGINATYAKMRMGFAKMFQDAAIVLNRSVAYNPTAGQVGGFPTWMNPTPYETAVFKGKSVY